MTEPNQAPQSSDLKSQGERLLARKLTLTKAVMLIEDLWVKLWPLFAVLSLFIIVSLFELWAHLGPITHRLALFIFALATLAALYPLKSIRWPNEQQALKRLDKGNTLPHQPAQAFKDKLAKEYDTPKTRSLWKAFKLNLLSKIKQLKVPKPEPRTAEKDPLALRTGLILLLGIGLFHQGGKLSSHLLKGLTPPPWLNITDLRLDAWVTPPTYTGQAPILIANGAEKTKQPPSTEPIKVPENAILTIRINGEHRDKVHVNPGTNQHHPQTKATKDKTSQEKTAKDFTIKLTNSGPLALTINGQPFAKWTFEVVEDIPPIIGLTDYPTKAKSGALKLSYKVVDDYGVISAKAHITTLMLNGKPLDKTLDEDQKPLGTPPEFALNLPQIGAKSGQGETFYDLTRHPWAGLEATLHLSATDEAGKTSQSPELTFTIPAYNFTNPVAKNIIRFQKQLVIAPFESGLIAQSLYALTAYKKPFKDDLSLYLGLRVAANRLSEAQSRREKTEVAELLYDLARHVEDGDLSQAERDLRTAQEELRKALQENASESELQKRIEALRQALNKYMQELAKNQKNQAPNNQAQNNNSLDSQQLEQMLKTIEELAKSGSRELAEKMLSQMQNMLENLQTGKTANTGKQSKTAKDLEELGKLLREQQRLMDETFKQNRQQRQRQQRQGQSPSNQWQQDQRGQNSQEQNTPGQENGEGKEQSLSRQQQNLRQQLEALLEQMQKGQNNQSLDNAGKAMERAQKLLKQQDLDGALSEEGQALDQLRKGMEKLAEQMGEGGPGGQRQGGKDPMGNARQGIDTSDSTEIPEKIDLQRAREILRELQEKMSNPNRSAQELDYFERLLKRF